MTTQLVASVPPVKLLRIREVAEQCGVCRATVYRWLHSGHLSSVKLGKTRRVPSDAVAAFIREGFAATKTEAA
jgi:excisionase family DNA binding protein